ncbi:MAG: arginase family protein [Armatimonadetes bacterium]|nr:arginase family protein [Armatimonadota bacterium]
MAYDDPGWNRASAWLKGESLEPHVELHVVGVPINRSVTPGSCHLAPAAIREALFRYSTQTFYNFSDVRHAKTIDHEDTIEVETLSSIMASGPAVLLGGDNGVTRLGVNALAKALGKPLTEIGLITLDAHLDLRHLDDGPMNGNPIRGLLADGLLGSNVVQIGIQSFANSPEYARFGVSQGIRTVSSELCHSGDFEILFETELERLADRCQAIYFDLDLDVMDRAFAPGCPGSRPGGLTPHHIRQAARVAGANPKVLVMDLVELDPELDINSATSMAAAACLLEFASGVLASS